MSCHFDSHAPNERTVARRLCRRWVIRAIFCALCAAFVYEGWFFARVAWYATHNPSETSFMRLRLAAMREKDVTAELRSQWAPYTRISEDLKRAVVMAEDDKFVGHCGFNWEDIQKALAKNQRK